MSHNNLSRPGYCSIWKVVLRPMNLICGFDSSSNFIISISFCIFFFFPFEGKIILERKWRSERYIFFFVPVKNNSFDLIFLEFWMIKNMDKSMFLIKHSGDIRRELFIHTSLFIQCNFVKYNIRDVLKQIGWGSSDA